MDNTPHRPPPCTAPPPRPNADEYVVFLFPQTRWSCSRSRVRDSGKDRRMGKNREEGGRGKGVLPSCRSMGRRGSRCSRCTGGAAPPPRRPAAAESIAAGEVEQARREF